MNLSAPFIHRPIATSLLAFGLLLSGIIAFRALPIAPIPAVDFPTIHVSASLPGADPITVATSVAAPLERRFAQIAGVNELTSSSTLGSVSIVLQFDFSRSIDGAARDVQAAIDAAEGDLPSNLVTLPTYRKSNPADAPIMVIALTSKTVAPGDVYNYANDVVAQQLSQVEGVSEVTVNGAQKSAVRVQIDPARLAALGLSMEQIRTFIGDTNSNLPKGMIDGADSHYTIQLNDQLSTAADYRNLVAFERNGTAIRLGDLGATVDSVQNTLQAGWANGQPAVLLVIFKEANANIIQTVDRIHALMPQFERWMPPAMKMSVMLDRTGTIRASVNSIEFTLLVCVALVVMTVFLFLRRLWATAIPSFTVPLALTGTFGLMYLCGYTLDNLSLMALAVAVGFVVDDAIVVLENVVRHQELGATPLEAALRGSRQIGFTIVAISLSLVAVFTPLIFMSGLVGRLMHEFAVTLSASIVISALVSLTFTPMMCSRFLRTEKSETAPNLFFRVLEGGFERIRRTYARGLDWVLDHQHLMLGVTVCTMAATVYLYIVIPKGFFPNVDNGYMMATTEAAQNISFKALVQKQQEVTAIVLADPAVQTAAAFMSGGNNNANMFIQLKPLNVRKVNIQVVIDRLRRKLSKVEGVALFMQAAQDLRVGGRSSKAQYQYTLQSSSLSALNHWAAALVNELKTVPGFEDVTSDEQAAGLEILINIDRTAAARFGINVSTIDNTLYDDFGQRQVSTIYDSLTQHYVVLEASPRYQLNPSSLDKVYVQSSSGTMVPLYEIATIERANTPLSIAHQGQFPATTVSFNLDPGYSLGQATAAINAAFNRLHVPGTVRGAFAGTAQVFQQSQSTQPLLLLAALTAVYLILGILYESLIHPLTIISTLPSAGLGALLALLLTGYDLSIVALIGILLLVGIVKKNAIMMIDFALQAEREQGLSSRDAIRQACLVRFRPIMMTTMAAICGALPLALESGIGSELHKPLGITIVGGLVLSQMLTLFTTPVVYIFLDRFNHRSADARLEVAASSSAPDTSVS